MSHPTPTPHGFPQAIAPRAWWQRWWSSQSSHRQDRFAMLAPLAAVLLFLAAIVAAFGYLRLEEVEREQEAVKRDLEYAQQRLRLRLLERQEQLMRLARDISNKEMDPEEFMARAEALVVQYPELQAITWIDASRRIIASQVTPSLTAGNPWVAGEKLKPGDTETTFGLARDLLQPVYSQPAASTPTMPLLQLHTPLTEQGHFAGVILGEYSIDNLLRYAVPTEISAKYAVTLLDSRDNVLAGRAIPERQNSMGFLPWATHVNEDEVPVSPVGNGLILRAQAWRTSLGVVGSGLFWLVCALSAMTAWMLIANWRHTRRRMHRPRMPWWPKPTFRRAMENSMLTGMRALDMQGRITYVNRGVLPDDGLVRGRAGRPHARPSRTGPRKTTPFFTRAAGGAERQDPAGGLQFRVKRKDGSLFDARLYVSPLIDALGKQSGWMTSMTDITEPNRIREQLSASYERFTTVLEALDASVSVAPLGSEELLFANKLYRLWFGTQATGHLQLVEQAGVPEQRLSDDGLDDVDGLAGLPTDTLTTRVRKTPRSMCPSWANGWRCARAT
jgi:PAS domain-containing protein